jgi:SAM-dependent methyltransferase/transcription elongation factor Elf1
MATLANVREDVSSVNGDEFRLRCTRCGGIAAKISDVDDGETTAEMYCQSCGASTYKVSGVWRSLSPVQRERFAAFIGDYEEIRRREGRGSALPEFYRALPFADLTGNFGSQWKIRGRSYRFLERHVLPRLEKQSTRRLRILDIGAGNGWLSYRLALRGLRPVAVDLCCNAWDGLEAARHYSGAVRPMFPRVEAEMDKLPFCDAQFDVAIFNASFHYSTDYAHTLREVLRCLHRDGSVLIVDSPTYKNRDSGEAMRAERRRQFDTRFGRPGDALPTGDYLTPEILDGLANLGIRWKRHLAWYGFRWWLRPWMAWIRRRRQPSQFYIYEGHMETT